MNPTIAGAIALLVAYAAGWTVRRFASTRVLDQPGRRSLHLAPTTRLGGVAVTLGLVAGLIGQDSDRLIAGVAVAVFLAGLLGLAEDVRGVPIPIRLVAQAATAVVASVIVLEGDTSVWLIVVAAVWIVTFINEYNFMDGVDGIAGALLGITGLTWIIAGGIEDVELFQVFGAVSLGCSLGFLPHNFPSARVFMGDLGSYGAGAWLATSAVVGIHLGIHPVTVLAPLSLFVFDATWTLGARAVRGENLFVSHRSHFYQRLVLAGWPQVKAVAFASCIAATVGGVGLLALADRTALDVLAIALGGAALMTYGFVAARVSGSVSAMAVRSSGRSTAENAPTR